MHHHCYLDKDAATSGRCSILLLAQAPTSSCASDDQPTEGGLQTAALAAGRQETPAGERVCNTFSDQPQQELQSDAGSLAKRSKVDKCIQEAQSRGKNAFEDGWDEAYHDGIEDHVLAERQSVRSSCDPSRFHREDEGFTPDFEVEDLKTMLARSVEKKSLRRKFRAASDKKPLDPTQSALPFFL